ncbi:MAG: glycosyltransferase [Colwellia sp.]
MLENPYNRVFNFELFMKKKVCIVLVCYNAYLDAKKLLNSLHDALKLENEVELTVVFSDNSTELFDTNSLYESKYDFEYQYIKNGNVGYFPGFYAGLQHIDYKSKGFDYIIVSNVDLVVESNFFNTLKKLIVNKNIGLVAPKIISDITGNDANPKIITRPTKRKINFMRMLCSNSLAFLFYQKLSFLKPKKKTMLLDTNKGINEPMYGAHGAFMIFTRSYFDEGGKIDYPRFLFGEEGFVAEELRRIKLKISHENGLVIRDKEHGSTSLESSKFICQEHKKSYDYFYINYLK